MFVLRSLKNPSYYFAFCDFVVQEVTYENADTFESNSEIYETTTMFANHDREFDYEIVTVYKARATE
jgi:hypothetical protein